MSWYPKSHGTMGRNIPAERIYQGGVYSLALALGLAFSSVSLVSASAVNTGNASANQAVNIEDKTETTAQGSDAYATYDSQGNLIVGKNNQVSPIQKDPKTGNARVDSKPENVVLGTRNGVGKFTHSTETKKPISGDGSYAYEKLDTEWITVQVYNPNTGKYDDKQVEVYKLTPGQYMDDEYNVRAKKPIESDYSTDAQYQDALSVYNKVADYYKNDKTRQSYYVSGATAVGVDNVAEGNHSTAIGNKAKVLNSVGSFYIDKDQKLTRDSDAAYYFLKDGQITTEPQYVKNPDGSYYRDQKGYYVKTSFLTVDRLIDSSDAVAIGSDVTAEGRSAVAIGHQSYAKEYSVAIGENSVTDYMGVAIGKDNKAKYASTAIGHTNDANGYYTATMGVNNTARADESTAIGYGNSVDGQQNGGTTPKAAYTHVLGSNNTVKGNYNAVFGDTNTVTGAYALALGGHNLISGANTNDADGDYGIAIGYGNNVEKNALALGLNSNSIHDGSIAIGNQVNTTGDNNNGATDSIAIGTKASVHIKNGIVLGNEAYAGNNGNNSEGAIAIGHQARSAAGESIAIGTQATTGNNVGSTGMTNIGAIAIGSNSTADTVYDIAMGWGANTKNTTNGGAIALGHNATIEQGGQASAAIGDSARVKENIHDAVALGSQSYAERTANNQGGYDPASGSKNHNAGSDPVWNSTLAAVSVGSSDHDVWDGTKNIHYAQQTRQITNVAAGKEDTDAVNVAQLRQVANLVHPGGGGGTGGSGVHDYSVKSVNSGTDTNYNNGGASGDNALAAGVSASATGAHSVAVGNGATAKGQDSIALGTGAIADGIGATAIGQYNTASGQNSLAFGENSTASGEASTAFGIGSTAAAKNSLAALGGTVAESAENAAAIGKNAQATLADSVALGSNSVTTRAKYSDLTDEEKKAVYIKGDSTGSAWEATDNAIAVGNDSKVTRQITGVAAGSLDTDAVNVAQLKKMAAEGLKFHGDSGDIVTRKLNTQLDVLGGQTDTTKLTATTDGNIGVVSTKAADENSNGKLEIRLAKELKGLTSVQTGDTTVNDGGLTINKAGNGGKDSITINKTAVSIAGNQITNMGSGIDGTKYTDAGDNNGANIGDVKKLADSRKTTVKSTDGSVKVTNTSTDSTHFDYDLSVDTTKVAGAVDLKYKGDNNTQGSNKLSEAVTFSGTANQIVTTAENGIVTFKLADDVTTQTITAVGKNGNDGQIGLTGKNGADGSVTTIIKTVGAKGTDGKDGIPGVDGQPGKDGITRLTYDETDDKGGTEHHVVATMDDGLKFMGNDNQEVIRKLNTTLSIKGGITDATDLKNAFSKNLGVRKSGDGLEIVMTDTPDFTKVTVGKDAAKKITIGGQSNSDTKNPANGNYITGLDNTKWDKDHVTENRAATEGQLRDVAGSITNEANGGGFALSSDEKGTDKVVKQDLGRAIQIKGDTTYKADGTVEKAGNIKTSVDMDNKAIKVELNKDVDLTKDGSIKAGNTTINSDGVETNKVKVGDITITDQGINGGAKQITNIASGLDSTKQYTNPGDNNAASIGDVKKIAGDEASKAAEAVKSKSGKNITVKDDHTVNLNDNITLGDETDASKQVSIDGNNAKVTAGDGANKVTVDGSQGRVTIGTGDKTMTMGKQANTAGDSNPAEGNYLNGLDNRKWDGEHIQSGRAATEDQLKTVSDKVNSGRKFQGDDGKDVTVDLGKTLNIKGGATAVSDANNVGIVRGDDNTLNVRLAKDLKGLDSVTTGNTTINNSGLTVKGDDNHKDITIQQDNVNMGGNKITGVAPGAVTPDSTDAVNGSQLYAAGQAISNLGGAVNKLGTRIDRVGAGSAALAALHPLDFDPDDKWDFAAGYGHYRGANAAAVGAYYRPNEDTMFSIGGSFGGGENMFNAGVSIKLGQGNHISTSRVAMAKEIKDLRENVAQLNQIVNRQSALIEKLTSVDTGSIQDKGNDLFPDVPENHWAYEYVTKLAKAGILKGYPDGNFAGDRMMTRYEFAAIVYRAITMGAASDPGLNQDGTLGKLAKEFNQELKFIRIDTIHQTDQGEPTVQRVRVQNTTK